MCEAIFNKMVLVKIHLQAFRKSHCVHAAVSLENGCPLPTVQHSLGHASISSTGRYLFLLSLNQSSGEYLSDFEFKKSKKASRKRRTPRKAKV